jgi:ferrous iron transport protein B
MAELSQYTVALAGNPNSGKTTIFNHLTGSRQKVGNWGGVTVEKKEGIANFNELELHVIDLPGTYSLSAYSLEEVVARDFIIEGKPDLVVHIVDTGNLERNLYLTTQLIELGVPLVIALNMFDEAQNKGLEVDYSQLSKLLGIPMVPTVGHRGKGIDKLLETIAHTLEKRSSISRYLELPYGQEIEDEITAIQKSIAEYLPPYVKGGIYPPQVEQKRDNEKLPPYVSRGEYKGGQPSVNTSNPRWLSLKLLENDSVVKRRLELQGADIILTQAQSSREHLEKIFHDDIETVLTDRRYGYVAGALRETTRLTREQRQTVSDQIDSVLTNRLLGFPVFFLFMWLLFQGTFSIGTYPQHWLQAGITWLGNTIVATTPETLLRSLVVDGVIGGVGGVLVFLPQILILFLGISILEDTGYMARAAFIMDKIMHTMGLHGKSFIPLLMGFGCNVPAIMATRTLESRRDRLLTILINPLMSCSARLPVYVLVAGIFFAAKAGNVIFSLYLLGIFLAIGVGQIFRRLLFRGEALPFVMELPPYRIPTMKSTFIHMWERASIYLRKMGGLILCFSIIIWFLGAFPRPTQSVSVTSAGMESHPLEHTYIGHIGKIIEPMMKPLGFDWQLSVAVLTGFVAKEIVVSTMGVLFESDNAKAGHQQTLAEGLHKSINSPLVAYAFLVFVLLYTPCLATVITIRREAGGWRWAALAVGYELVLAWLLAFAIYQGGHLLRLG